MPEKHTLGPLTTKGPSVKKLPHTDGGDYAIIDSKGKIIAEAIYKVGRDDFRPALANAKLYAAAPDLLEACEAVLDVIQATDLNGVALWIRPPYQAAAVHETATERLDAALARAGKV